MAHNAWHTFTDAFTNALPYVLSSRIQSAFTNAFMGAHRAPHIRPTHGAGNVLPLSVSGCMNANAREWHATGIH